MKGICGPDGRWDGTITRILRLGGFTAKQIVVGRDCTEEEAASLGGWFLGVGYSPQTDELTPKTNPAMRVSQKRRGKQKGKDVVQLDEGKINDIL